MSMHVVRAGESDRILVVRGSAQHRRRGVQGKPSHPGSAPVAPSRRLGCLSPVLPWCGERNGPAGPHGAHEDLGASGNPMCPNAVRNGSVRLSRRRRTHPPLPRNNGRNSINRLARQRATARPFAAIRGRPYRESVPSGRRKGTGPCGLRPPPGRPSRPRTLTLLPQRVRLLLALDPCRNERILRSLRERSSRPLSLQPDDAGRALGWENGSDRRFAPRETGLRPGRFRPIPARRPRLAGRPGG